VVQQKDFDIITCTDHPTSYWCRHEYNF